jgi:hypothetical protein
MEKVVCRSGGQNGTGSRVIASHKRFKLLQISASGAPATAAAVAAPIETPVTATGCHPKADSDHIET